MNDSNNRKFGAILSYISIIMSTIIQLLYTPFLIGKLGQSEYGLYSLINSVIGYLTVLDLGFGNAIIVFTAKYRAQKKYDEVKKLHGMFFIIFCIIGILAGLLGFILYLNVEGLFGSTMSIEELNKAKIMMLILTFNLVITFIFSIYSSIINAYEKFIYQKLLSILNTILKPLIMIPLLFLGYKSITMVVVITILNVLAILSNYLYCRKKLNIKIKFEGFDKIILKTILGYSIWIFLGTIVDKINWSVDQFILGAVSGTVAVSIYSVASQINTLFINLSTAISGVLLPKISKMIAQKENNQKLTEEFIKVGRIQYYVIFLVCTGFVLVGKKFIIWWIGKDFIDSYYVTLLLIIPVSVPLIQNLGLSIMQAMNKYKFKSISTFIMAIFNIIISYYLAQRYGAIGSALGTTIALVACNIILINIYYYKILKLNVIKFWLEILKMTVTFVPSILIILAIMYFTNFSNLISILIYGFIFIFLYILSAYFITMNKYEKSLVNSIILKKGREYND